MRRFSLLLAACLSIATLPSEAVVLRGRTYFDRPPRLIKMVTFFQNVNQYSPEYYVVLNLLPDSGEPLGSVTLQQTEGVDRFFLFRLDATRAYVGEPRRFGAEIPVAETTFDNSRRLLTVRFAQPVAPGQQITIVVRPQVNPDTAGTYLWGITAYPAGEQPSGQFLGFGRINIYEPSNYRSSF
ncbi:DUF2808 domain-containing protein [Synechococcus elongatus]|uniref:DUF2808 domain-containing protein n=1 Tax=Synechococcus elongatus PCC 11802 TaxID=2283154 RepID=A0AAT9JX50_SYNEL|nr:DUF2808 domain-containing protein [Synechococcus elongatus]QFZ93216.1 DUF2808 domain-containing protein [Synechococcus elongatus PCC 11802]